MAIQLYQKVIETAEAEGDNNLSARAYVQIALCYERLQKKQEAIQAYQKALLLSPMERRDPDEVIRNLKRADEQLIFLGEIPEANLKDLCDHYYREAEKVQNENPAKAIELYRHAIRISKFLDQMERAAYAGSFIGDLYRRMERYEDALNTYREVQREFSQEIAVLAWSHIRMGETRRLMGDLAEAAAAYQALEQPLFEKQVQQRFWANLWLADTLRSQDRTEEARKIWQELRSDQPEAPLPARLASFMLGEQTLEIPEEPEDPFSNDVAYFVAVRQEMIQDREAAHEAYQKCIRLSQGFDWPRQMAAKALGGNQSLERE